jgi:hypothetical protein
MSILTEVDSYNWIAFLPMSDGSGTYNRYFGRLVTGKMKIRGAVARKGIRSSMCGGCKRCFLSAWARPGAWRC